jgi:dCMP deaminase
MRRKVGAVIVKDNRILSTGYNGAPSGVPNCIDDCNRCYRSKHNIPSGEMLDMCFAVHAEQNAIMNALKTGEDLKGAVIYVNTYPCVTCFKLIVQSGIREVYFINEYANDFTKQLAREAGVKLVKLDGSIYRTPVGTDVKSDNDLDAIDPLVAQIYKYTPGTEKFKMNRDLVFRQNGLYERYDEMIYYTDYKTPCEIVPVTDRLYSRIKLYKANRNTLEYNGDNVKQLVIGAIVYDVHKNELIVLKCKGERFKDKFTMIQGHMAVGARDTEKTKLKTIMNRNLKKEVTEELNLRLEDIIEIEPLYLIQSNDNKVSSEHMGVISLIKIDTSMLEYNIESGEPEKHDVAHLTKYDLSNMELMCRYDTWLKKVIIKMKEDGRL